MMVFGFITYSLPFMSEHQVTALRYEVEQVGKHIKSTKKRYFWALSIGPRCYNFILDDSLVSGKSKLSINGKVFHQTQESGLNRCRYDHSFVIDGCLFNISEVEEGYEMRVDNKLFSHMLNKEMTKKSFEEHRVQEGEFQLAGRIKGENKKITLSLPGMGNGMKKKKMGAVQSENWGEFAGSTSFPNYFGESQAKKTAQTVAVPQEVSLAVKEEPSVQQFSTLQNLFKTINACGEYVPKATEGATPTYEISEIPVIPEINLQEFTTMQQLFATVSGQPAPKVEEKPVAQPKVDDFNTMQNLFTTLKFPEAQKTQAPKVSVSVPKAEDFNTMQNMFSTLKLANQSLPSIPQDLSKINLADFSTLQNLFATGVQIPMPVQKQVEEQVFQTAQSFTSTQQAKPQKQPDYSKINVNDFNTMQNLFATNALGVRDVLGSTDKANKIQQPAKTEPLPNQFDFNTMQNLFATTSGKSQKNENKFWQF